MNLDDIKCLIDNINSLQQIAIKEIESKINYIIDNKIVDDNLVEKIFEELLNLLQTDEVTNLYKKLCFYYYNINTYLVNDYIEYYKDMYLDPDDYKILELK